MTFFVSQVFGLVENFNIGIYSDTINVTNVKLCLMVLLIELYLFIQCVAKFYRAVGRSFGPMREGRRSRPPRVSQLWVK